MFLWQKYASSIEMQSQIAIQISHDKSLTWQAVGQRINEYAFELFQQGVEQDTGVALISKNSLELLLLYLAVIQLGGRVLLINPNTPLEKIDDLCLDNQIEFYYSPVEKKLINATALYFVERSEKTLQSAVTIECDLLRPATMTLTSGSTGKPKAVVHNLKAHLDNAKGVCTLMHFSKQNSWLLSLPMFHVSGQGIIWRWLYKAAQLHLPTEDFYFSVMQSSHVSLVPTQLQRLLSYLQQHRNNTFNTKGVLLGGMQISVELTEAARKLNIETYSGYGMTEMASTIFAKKSDDKCGVGQPLLGREFRLEGNEIWVRGAGLAMGYWQNSEIVPLTNQQGWLQTKDLGIWQNNELIVQGRLDNMFISGGENIQPEQIEKVLKQSDDVVDAFVLPIDDKEFGQRPVAMVKFKDNFSQSAVENLQDFLQNRIERFKQPVAYFPLDTEKCQQDNVKISRAFLKKELKFLLGK